MKRAVLYMRMSTDKNTQENSIKSQEKSLLIYAENNKMSIIEKYIDEGISGRTAQKRPAFLKMIDDSEKNLFDFVLVYDSSRFARNLEESIVYKSALKRNGVKLISITEPSLDDDTNLITDAMLGALNEMYSRKLSKAVKRGMEFNASKGIYQNAPPFGYKKENKEIRILEKEAETVKLIFNLFLEKENYHSVAVILNEYSIKNRKGNSFRSADIKRILQNPCYIGKVFYNGNLYNGTHKCIIESEIFEKANKIISEKSKKNSRPPITYKHWLSGILKCSECNSAMNFAKDTKGNCSYRCGGNRQGICGYSNFISVKYLEEILFFALDEIFGSKNLENYDFENIADYEKELLINAIKKIAEKLTRTKEAYICGIDSISEYQKNKKILTEQKFEFEKKLEELKNPPIIKSEISISALIKSSDYSIEQKNSALKEIFEKIIINKNLREISIYYFDS